MQFLIFAIVYPFVWVLSKLPMRILYAVSNVLFIFVYYIFKYRKEVVLDNLGMAFPEKSLEEKKRISKQFFKHFTDSFVETIKAISISKKEILQRYQYKNPELVKEFLDQGKSIAFVSAHQANWEWFASAPMVFNCRARGAYTSIGNQYFDKIVKESRERFGFICYESAKTVKAFSKKKLIPIAVIKSEILGALLSGLYATLSVNIPKSAEPTTAKITAALTTGWID